MEYFIMRMGQNMKDIGKTTWNKVSLFIQIKMEIFNWYCLKKIEWSDKIIQQQLKN